MYTFGTYSDMLRELDVNSPDMGGLLSDISTTMKITNAQKMKLKMAVKKLQNEQKSDPNCKASIKQVDIVTIVSQLNKCIDKLNNIYDKYTVEKEKYLTNENLKNIENKFVMLHTNLSNCEKNKINKLSKQNEINAACINGHLSKLCANIDLCKTLIHQCNIIEHNLNKSQLHDHVQDLNSPNINRVKENVNQLLNECEKDIQLLEFEWNINSIDIDVIKNNDNKLESKELENKENCVVNVNDCNVNVNVNDDDTVKTVSRSSTEMNINILCTLNDMENINKYLIDATSRQSRSIKINNFRSGIIYNRKKKCIKKFGIGFDVKNLILDRKITTREIIYSANGFGQSREIRYYYNIILQLLIDYNDGNGFVRYGEGDSGSGICTIKRDYVTCFFDGKIDSVTMSVSVKDDSINFGAWKNLFKKNNENLKYDGLIDLIKQKNVQLIDVEKIKRLVENWDNRMIDERKCNVKILARVRSHETKPWSKPIVSVVEIECKDK